MERRNNMAKVKLDIGYVIHDMDEDKDYRIIYKANNYIAAILMTERDGKFEIDEFDQNTLLEMVKNHLVAVREPNFKYFDPDALSEKNRAIYERNRDIVNQVEKEYGPCYFELMTRKPKPLIKELSKKYNIKPRAVIYTLKAYLSAGMNEYSLLSKKGEHDSSNIKYQSKTGRKSTYGNMGVTLTGDIIKIFDEATKKYLSGREKTYQNVYDWMCATYFVQRIEKEDKYGKSYEYKLLPIDQRPTKRQMENYIRKHTTKKQRDIAKTSRREYRNNKRLLVSDNLYNVHGPGDVVEMDEVEMDVSLVSEADPTKVIGRPIVHVMIDIYSRMIIAVSVSLENNSVLGLTNCLINLAEDNKALCRRFGLELKDGLWDINIIPNKIRSDRGSEYRSKEAKRIFRELGITLDLEPPAMGSMKGQVEQLFHQYHSVQNDVLEGNGLITKRHDSNHHNNAVLTLNDIWIFVINQTIAHNMLTMKEYPLTKDMIRKKVHPNPLEIWNYGCTKFGAPRPMIDKKQFEYIIRKPVTAKLSRKGIFWNGLYYYNNSDVRLLDRIQVLGNTKESFSCRVDERDIGTLWYINDGRIEVAELNMMRNGNAEYNGMSLRAYEEFKKAKKQLIAENAHKDEEIRVARRMGLEATVNNARQAVANIPVSKDKTKGIRESRKLESETNLEKNSIQSRLQNETKAIESKSNDLLIDASKQKKTEEKVKNEYDLENETSIENILKQINNEMW
ncbi:transposase [Absicoccus porci]|uniref:Transposase n=2 Tax=Absicoccus porci TaxID=2486576 RepID=A0A3N0I3L8_9FIRM|nr:transposase [Absicoccus porci]